MPADSAQQDSERPDSERPSPSDGQPDSQRPSPPDDQTASGQPASGQPVGGQPVGSQLVVGRLGSRRPLSPGGRPVGPRRGRRTGWLLGAGLAAAVALGSAGAYQLTNGDQGSDAAPATARVQRGTVTVAVAAAGTLQPAQTRGLAFSMDGTVTEVRVRAGAQVSAGQVLARIDDADAEDRVSSAQEALDTAQDSLDKAQDTAASTSSGSTAGACLAAAGLTGATGAGDTSAGRVVAVALAASPSPSPSRSAAASPSPSATAGSPRPSTSPTRTRTSQPAQNGQNGGQNTGQNGGEACNRSTGTGSNNAAGGGTDRVLTAEQQVNSARQQLEEAEQNLAGTTITAPIAGKVLSVAGAVGSRATSGGTGFIVLGDVADMQVKADFPEADAIGLKVGQQATVTLADRPGVELAAKVTQVDPVGTVDGQMVRFGVLLAFDKVPDNVLNGQSANVRVQTQSATDVLYVPASAVHDSTAASGGASSTPNTASTAESTATGGGGTGVVMVRVGGSTQQRQVEVGLQGDQYTEISSGLTQGEEILTSW